MTNETMNDFTQDNEACTSEHPMPSATDHSVALATYIGAFFDELIRGGVSAVVVSPGSRSTPLSMMAYASDLDVYVDVDERGAAFFALGLAKATGQAVAVICTSGTAVANYYPAVLEAESSRAAARSFRRSPRAFAAAWSSPNVRSAQDLRQSCASVLEHA
ncbi:MAG: thiamine pyrophosphate-binding protein [Eggerthellaceae bacterium]